MPLINDARKLRRPQLPPTIDLGSVETGVGFWFGHKLNPTRAIPGRQRRGCYVAWRTPIGENGIGPGMRTLDAIVAKRDGLKLAPEVLRAIISDYTSGAIPDYQMSALLMAIFFRGLDHEELSAWTDAMIHSGKRMNWGELSQRAVDKHSTGGVGDKISLPLAPAVAACGAVVPMVSGRGLGHTGGTLDKLESIPGFTVSLPMAECSAIIHKLGLVLIGQTGEIAPADKKIYALRDASGTVENIPLISSSIMSKKLAEGLSGLVLDVKVGSGAFMKTLEDAERLAHTLVGIGNRMGCTTVAHITRMDRPLGRKVGNALEVVETLEVLRGGGPDDVRELVLTLGAEMLVLANITQDADQARERIRASLDNGAALRRFQELIEAQGGNPRVVDDPGLLPVANSKIEVKALRSGTIQTIDTAQLGIACCLIGGGRAKASDVIDPAVGMEVIHTVGDTVQVGDPLVVLHLNDISRVFDVSRMVEDAYVLGDQQPPATPLLIERIV